MAASMKDSDAQVTYEDQQNINRFARTNSRLMDFKEELAAKEKEFENLKDAEDELLMAEGDSDVVPYQIGEVLVEMTLEEAQAALEKAKITCQQEIDTLKQKTEAHKDILNDLKTALYAKFGTNINLDLDDES
ncbi:prefoldin subunit 4-like [Biomphalaria glabrata]|uniref:Prefoldin subunit 4 n=1 Tax=Biomphalaria glabrata TaxID=6526 RepID=A0A9W3AZF8_BIOGL|nr:prefoldin subunit 4-like [Biomphalaria glabrata]